MVGRTCAGGGKGSIERLSHARGGEKSRGIVVYMMVVRTRLREVGDANGGDVALDLDPLVGGEVLDALVDCRPQRKSPRGG